MKITWRRILLIALVLLGTGGYFALRQMQRHRLPAAVWQCLRHPQRVTVYSLHWRPAMVEAAQRGIQDPASALAGVEQFQGYRILGQAEMTTAEDRARASDAIGSAASAVFVAKYACFDPRHGVRVTDGQVTYDFVLYYECQGMVCREGEKTIAQTEIGGSSRVLDSLLLAAHVPIEKLPWEK